MALLTRQHIIEHIEAAASSDPAALAGWAFDQFYSEEEGSVEFEPGYRDAIGAVLDELMFADEPQFNLSADNLRALADGLRTAQPRWDDEDEEDDDDDSDEA